MDATTRRDFVAFSRPALYVAIIKTAELEPQANGNKRITFAAPNAEETRDISPAQQKEYHTELTKKALTFGVLLLSKGGARDGGDTLELNISMPKELKVSTGEPFPNTINFDIILDAALLTGRLRTGELTKALQMAGSPHFGEQLEEAILALDPDMTQALMLTTGGGAGDGMTRFAMYGTAAARRRLLLATPATAEELMNVIRLSSRWAGRAARPPTREQGPQGAGWGEGGGGGEGGGSMRPSAARWA